MTCPIDKTQLVITDREGVEIDYCPTCRGVWLDRGEIDKIMDRSKKYDQQDYDDYRRDHDDRRRHDDDADDDDRRYHQDKHYGKKRKKESFLGDLFDF